MSCANNVEFAAALRKITDEAEGRMRTRLAKDSQVQSPFQAKVIAEKQELDNKAQRLSLFIGINPIFDTLDPEHQELLKEQCEVMWNYSEILGKRIALFK